MNAAFEINVLRASYKSKTVLNVDPTFAGEGILLQRLDSRLKSSSFNNTRELQFFLFIELLLTI